MNRDDVEVEAPCVMETSGF